MNTTDSRHPLQPGPRGLLGPDEAWPGASGRPSLPAWEEDEPRLVGCVRDLLRGWRAVAGAAAACLVVALGYLLLATPRYTAEAQLLIERHAPELPGVQELIAEGATGDDYYRTQEKILESRGLMVDTIRELGLDRDPRFAPQGETRGLLAGWAAAVGRALGGGDDVARTAARAGGVDPRLLDRYRQALSVSAVSRTRLVVVRFTSPDPALAAEVVNAHVKAYIRQGLRLRTEASAEARRFLETKRAELEQRLESSEAALNAYRKDHGIVSVDEHQNVVVERLSKLNDLLSQAEGERIRREAEAKLLEGRDYGALPQVADNTLIHAMKSRLSELEADYTALAAEFKPTYPAVQRARARVQEMRERLEAEIGKIVGAVQSAYLAAVENENELRKKVEEQKSEVLELKDAAVRYAILDREVESNRTLYESVLDRVKEVGITGASRASNVSVIEPAIAPAEPSWPRAPAVLALALLGGLGVGIAFVLGRGALDRSLNTPEQVERHLRLPVLGSVPDVVSLPVGGAVDEAGGPLAVALEAGSGTGEGANGTLPTGAVRSGSSRQLARAALTEAYRGVRTGILFSRAEAPPRVLLFSSAVPFEGKTTSALHTAVAFSRLGGRVLVIDADLRRPRCHEILGARGGPGLSEVLTGQNPLDAVVQHTPLENLELVCAGRRAPNPTELLGSRAMARTLEQTLKAYDHVVVDAPPVLAVSDAVVLSPFVEGVVLVLKAHATPRQLVQRAEARLRQAHANVLGVVLNQLDVRRDGYSGYYGGSYYAFDDSSDAAGA